MVDLDLDLGTAWNHLVQEMMRAERINALVRELALQSQLLRQDRSAEPAVWYLQIENRLLDQAQTRDRLQQALAQHGWPVRLEVGIGPAVDTPAQRIAKAAAQQLKAAEQTLLQDPFVQEMMHAFGGTIVPGSLQAISPAAT